MGSISCITTEQQHTSTMKSFVALALVAAAAASPIADKAPAPAPAYAPSPAYAPAPAYRPAYKPVAYKEEPTAAPVYTYNYAVADQYENLDFTQEENRENYATSGSYRVALPDGRTQIVSYRVDGDSGYVADVSYEGEAQYPPEKEYKPAPAAYKPAYKPVYAPAPAYQA